eukprot:TRINITY_DN8567_c0_g1_i6.p1 TRINITY_DN8567_c0_g1~~TRINITY_DN8567_c0_g1_i6.p1  ORF type:complete len:425 (+),score=165.90 TRINITY_DN8567_c0_g1_i6:82-1356(+)
MRLRLAPSPAPLLLLALLLAAAPHRASGGRKPVLRKPVSVNGRPYQLSKGAPKEMCKAVISEMHAEVLKHNLRKDGEDEIFETAGMAICLGVVQNYIFEERQSGKWALRRKTPSEKEAEEEGGLASMPIEGMMLVKEACFAFCDELQQEISEMTYKRVGQGQTPEQIAADFCVPDVLDPAPKKKAKPAMPKGEAKRRADKAARDADAFGGPGEEDMGGKYEQFLEKMNRDGSITDLLRTDRDNPELLLGDEHQKDVREGRVHIRCAACRVGVRQTRAAASADDDEGRAVRDEARLSHLALKAFIGQEEQESDNMDYVPGNPPKWAEGYTVVKGKKGVWELRRLGRGEELAETEGADQYTVKVKRNTMVAQACRQAWDLAEEADVDLAELIVKHPDWDAKRLGEHFCAPACKGKTRSGSSGDGEL